MLGNEIILILKIVVLTNKIKTDFYYNNFYGTSKQQNNEVIGLVTTKPMTAFIANYNTISRIYN